MAILIDGEIGSKCAGELRNVYCALGNLKEMLDGMHDMYVQNGTPPPFATIEAAYVKMNGIYDDLERFILPIIGPDSVYREAGDDTPTCRI